MDSLWIPIQYRSIFQIWRPCQINLWLGFVIYCSTTSILLFLSPYIRRTLNFYTFKPSDGFISSCIYSDYLVEATQNQTEEEGIYYYYYCKLLPRRRRGYYGSSKRKLNWQGRNNFQCGVFDRIDKI